MKTVTVPAEPTQQMLTVHVTQGCCLYYSKVSIHRETLAAVYKAMLEAAPAPPSDLTRLRAENEALRKALVVCRDWFEDRYDGAPDSGCRDMGEPMEAANVALAMKGGA